MEKEELIAEMYMDDKVEYTKFLDDTIGKSGLNHLWEYAKRRLNHYKIDLLY